MSQALARFNRLEAAEAEQQLLGCCSSSRWAAALTAARPFADLESLIHFAESVWAELAPEDWLEAFAAHPRIGERPGGGSSRSLAWSQREQSRALVADREVLGELAAGNLEYERRFGFVYLVCATDRPASELLELLHSRLDHDPQEELAVAAEEQAKITRLRLRRLLEAE